MPPQIDSDHQGPVINLAAWITLVPMVLVCLHFKEVIPYLKLSINLQAVRGGESFYKMDDDKSFTDGRCLYGYWNSGFLSNQVR